MKVSGAIFDIDGTVTDSLWVWDGVPEKFLKWHGKTPNTSMKELETLNTAQIGQFFKENYFQDSHMTAKDIILRFGFMGYRKYAFHVPLMPGARELLKYLKQQDVSMYILTANDPRLVNAALRRNRVYRYFDGILDGSDPENAKDHPEAFENALKVLGTPKDETLVFEDSLYAVQNAKAAGFPVVAINNRRDDFQEELKELADFYVHDYRELLPELG